MSTCLTPTCGEQHGLVDGVCSDCDLVARVLLNDRVLSRVQEAASVLKRHGLLGGVDTLDLATRDFGVPSRKPAVASIHALPEAFWADPCWSDPGQRGTTEAPVATESVQRACPTGFRITIDRSVLREADRHLAQVTADRCNAFWSRDRSKDYVGWNLSPAENARILRARQEARRA